MYPLITHGDVVFYKSMQIPPNGLLVDKLYLLQFELNGTTYRSIKYVKPSDRPGFYRLESSNPLSQPYEIPWESIRFMALIQAGMRKF